MEVSLTCVSPKYQRRGIGIQLHEKVFVSIDWFMLEVTGNTECISGWLRDWNSQSNEWRHWRQTSLQLVAVAAERGIPLITANATSTYTQKIYANDGFDVVEEVIYQDFLVGRKWARIQKSCLIWSKFIPSTLIYLKALNQGNIICWKVDGEAVFHVEDSPHKSVQLVAKKSS